MARRFADAVEAGKYGDIQIVAVVAVTGEGTETFSWGREAANPYLVAGILSAGAKSLV